MAARRSALLVGTGRYEAPKLPRIRSAERDVAELKRTLLAPGPGAFDRVDVLVDSPKARIELGIETLLTRARTGDLVLLYFSCHGEKSTDGLLHFLTKDTRRELLNSTAVSAAFVHRQLEQSLARSKVVLLDCCFSGAFATGLTTKAASSADAEQVQGRGTYVITASNEIEYAFSPDDGREIGSRGTSLFTGLVVKGLRGAAPGHEGWIGCDELFDYITYQMRGRASQTPTRFAAKVQGTIRLARCGVTGPTGEAAASPPAQMPRPPTGVSVDTDTDREAEDLDRPLDSVTWVQLMSYYQRCVSREAILGALVEIEDKERFAPWPGGPEPLLSDQRATVSLPDSMWQVAARDLRDNEQLRFGYPLVLVEPEKRNGRPGSWRAAPLLVADCAVERAGSRLVLRRTGPITLNRELVSKLAPLDSGELEDLATAWESQTAFGGVDQLGAAARRLLDELGIATTQAIDPGSMAAAVAGPRFTQGAQNVAMLYRADAAASATAGLLADLREELAAHVDAIPGTALGSLLAHGSAPATGSALPYDLVAPYPLNEAQEAVITAAMTRRLTVATGPPGTGKSQLITALVATAIASGQSVLMASTNNEAVEVVVERANRLVPGRALAIRTGNQEKRSRVPEILRELLAAPGRPVDMATPRNRLRAVSRRIREARGRAGPAGGDRAPAGVAGREAPSMGGRPWVRRRSYARRPEFRAPPAHLVPPPSGRNGARSSQRLV
jgi:hypothetical protein